MNSLLRFALVLCLAGTSACHFSFGSLPLNFSAERSQDWSLDGVTSVHIISGAGGVEIFGVEGRSSVHLDGIAKASSQEALDIYRVVATRMGGTLRLEPQLAVELDPVNVAYEMRIELPRHLAITVTDGSGSIQAVDVHSLEIVDGSGSIELNRIESRVSIKDGSGSITLHDLNGDLEIIDGSGSIVVTDLGGSLTLTDGSGSVEVVRVRGSVHVIADGSGSLNIQHVDGDVRIDVDGSGDITLFQVRGAVELGPTGSGSLEIRNVTEKVIYKD